MQELEQTKPIVGILFSLETEEGVKFNFQNFFKDNNGVFTFEFEDYNYLPIQYDPPERNTNLDNFENNISLPAIPLIINLLEAYDYFINSIVDTKIILRGFPTIPIIAQDKCVITAYTIQDNSKGEGGVSLVIQAPDNAVNSSFPNLFYFTGFSNQALELVGYIPNVPISNSANIS